MGLVPLGAGGFDVRTEFTHQATQERDGSVGLHSVFPQCLSHACERMGGSANTQCDVAALLQLVPVFERKRYRMRRL